MSDSIEALTKEIAELEKKKKEMEELKADTMSLADIETELAVIENNIDKSILPPESVKELDDIQVLITKAEEASEEDIFKETALFDEYKKRKAITSILGTDVKLTATMQKLIDDCKVKIKKIKDDIKVKSVALAILGKTVKTIYPQIKDNYPLIMKLIDDTKDMLDKIDSKIFTVIKNEINIISATDIVMQKWHQAGNSANKWLQTDKSALTNTSKKTYTLTDIDAKINEFKEAMEKHIGLSKPVGYFKIIIDPTDTNLKILKKFFDDIADKIEAVATRELNAYKNKLESELKGGQHYSQRGGRINIFYEIFVRDKFNIYSKLYLDLLDTWIANKKTKLAQLSIVVHTAEDESGAEATTDYVSPLRALLQYRIGSPTDIDLKLIAYCASVGLSQDVVLSIYFAETKSDIVMLLTANKIAYQSVLMNILRLKKLSAHKKFLRDYQVQESQLGMLYSHRQLYI